MAQREVHRAVAFSAAILVAATGWLYLARPVIALPGPLVHDALPLDELSKHGSVPVEVYVAVWVTAATLLGLVSRWARAGRLTAGLVLALGLGGWLYALDGLSILVVRQVPAHQAFHAAAAEQAVAIPAGLSKALVAPLAAALIVSARSLARGSRRGWQLAVLLLAALLVLHVERRFDDGAIVTGIAVVALLARRADFRVPGDPS